MDFAEAGQPVGEKLRALHAEDAVEAGIGEGHGQRAGFHPTDRRGGGRRGLGSGDSEHGGVDIEAGDLAGWASFTGGQAGDGAGGGGDVEDAQPGEVASLGDDLLSPGPEQMRDQMMFEGFSGGHGDESLVKCCPTAIYAKYPGAMGTLLPDSPPTSARQFFA